MQKSLLLLLSFTFFYQLYGQEKDSTYSLAEVHIFQERIRTELFEQKIWDAGEVASFQMDRLGDLLARQGLAYIKTYGPGTLATSSIRGGNASQTMILWNGIPLQSPMLGQLDLSLLPLNAVEQISIQKGGNSTLWGSGAVGGTIALNSQANFNTKLSLDLTGSVGSFGKREQQVQLAVGNGRIQSRTKFFSSRATNNFPYIPAPGIEPKRLTNSTLRQANFLQDISLLFGKSRIDIHYWHQDSYREIPPTIVQNESQAYQEDRSNRLLLDYSFQTHKLSLSIKGAVVAEELNYYDPQILLESESQFQNYIGELSVEYRPSSKHSFHLGSTINYNKALSSGLRNEVDEMRQSLFGSWRWVNSKLQLQSSLRQQWVDLTPTPPMPAIDISYALNPTLRFRSRISRNFRLPTLNDRFWVGGGNPELLPESGFSQEIKLELTDSQKYFFSKLGLGIFNRNIDNWIMWSIRSGERFWSANNITEVWSRGLESRLEKSFQLGQLAFQAVGAYDFVLSTNQTELLAPRMSAGSQLLYTPKHQAFASLEVNWNSLTWSYQHRLVGASQGINASIPAFHTADCLISYQWEKKWAAIQAFFEVKNLMNQQYQVIERRPMPGINFQAGIKLHFHKSKTK